MRLSRSRDDGAVADHLLDDLSSQLLGVFAHFAFSPAVGIHTCPDEQDKVQEQGDELTYGGREL